MTLLIVVNSIVDKIVMLKTDHFSPKISTKICRRNFIFQNFTFACGIKNQHIVYKTGNKFILKILHCSNHC